MHNAISERGGCDALLRPAQSNAPLRVYIEPTSRGSRGQYYSVSFDGQPLIAKTLQPSYDACRRLSAMGYSGRLEVWDHERSYPRLIFRDLQEAAGFTVAEGVNHGPRLVRYQEWPDPFEDDGCRPGIDG